MMKKKEIVKFAECRGVRRDLRWWEDVDLPDALVYLWDRINAYYDEHCRTNCIFCKNERPRGSNCFHIRIEIYNAYMYIPEDIYSEMQSYLVHGNCPVCAILQTVKQYPELAKYSQVKPLSENSLPCSAGKTVIESLLSLNLSHPYFSSLEPRHKLYIKERFEPGQKIVQLLFNLVSMYRPEQLREFKAPSFSDNTIQAKKNTSYAAAKTGDIATSQSVELLNKPVFAPSLTNNFPDVTDAVAAGAEQYERGANWALNLASKLGGPPQPSKVGDSLFAYDERQDAELYNEWLRAKASNVSKMDFAKSKDISPTKLQNALDRHRKRGKR